MKNQNENNSQALNDLQCIADLESCILQQQANNLIDGSRDTARSAVSATVTARNEQEFFGECIASMGKLIDGQAKVLYRTGATPRLVPVLDLIG